MQQGRIIWLVEVDNGRVQRNAEPSDVAFYFTASGVYDYQSNTTRGNFD